MLPSISLSQPEIKSKIIMDFSSELFTSHHRNPPDNPPSSAITPLVCVVFIVAMT